jgi:predicted small lipoprotein YifL
VRRSTAFAALLLLAACGKQGALEPRAGRPAPQRAATQVRAATPQEMPKIDPQAVPQRVDDNQGALPERGNDPFNLPPPREDSREE